MDPMGYVIYGKYTCENHEEKNTHKYLSISINWELLGKAKIKLN